MASKLSEKDKQKLIDFQWDHLYYINQIFGDIGLREFIAEIYPSKWELLVKSFPPNGDFEGSFHHILQDKKDHHQLLSRYSCSQYQYR